jgi:hypothetical protein
MCASQRKQLSVENVATGSGKLFDDHRVSTLKMHCAIYRLSLSA